MEAADVNGDGKVTTKDAARIRQYLAKWDVVLEAGKATLQAISEDLSETSKLMSVVESDMQITIQNQTAHVGDEITVPILLINNPGITGFNLEVAYDADCLELIGAKDGDYSDVTFEQNLSSNPYSLNWVNGTQDVSSSVAAILTFKVKNVSSDKTLISLALGNNEYPYNTSDVDYICELVNGIITILPAADSSISNVAVNDKTVIAAITCPDSSAFVFCGVYNNSGKMIAVRSTQITSESNYQFQFDGQQFDYARVFILDNNFYPLCESKRS